MAVTHVAVGEGRATVPHVGGVRGRSNLYAIVNSAEMG